MIDYPKLSNSEFSIIVKSVFILAQIPNCPLSPEELAELQNIKGDIWAEMAKRGQAIK